MGHFFNIYVIIILIVTVWLGIIGYVDDYIKVFKKNKQGLAGRFKILGQISVGLIVGVVFLVSDEIKVRDYDNSDVLDNAKRFYYLRKTCYRGMLRYNKNGKFNIPYGRYKTYNFEEIKNKEYEELLKRTDIFNSSFENIFNEYNDSDNFMFLDPPYDSEFTDYGYCTFGKEEQKKLAKCFKETNIKCLMIIGKTPFIQELYTDYIVDEYDKKYKFKLHSGRVGDEINTKHLIIKNY